MQFEHEQNNDPALRYPQGGYPLRNKVRPPRTLDTRPH
jgi:hypothetical protein